MRFVSGNGEDDHTGSSVEVLFVQSSSDELPILQHIPSVALAVETIGAVRLGVAISFKAEKANGGLFGMKIPKPEHCVGYEVPRLLLSSYGVVEGDWHHEELV